MVRWLIAVLFVANMLAFVAVRGTFGPLPAAGSLEPGHLAQQVRPETLRITPISSEADLTVIGAPIAPPNVGASPLGTSAAAAAASAATGAAASTSASSVASTPAAASAPAPAPASAGNPAAARAPATPPASAPAASH